MLRASLKPSEQPKNIKGNGMNHQQTPQKSGWGKLINMVFLSFLFCFSFVGFAEEAKPYYNALYPRPDKGYADAYIPRKGETYIEANFVWVYTSAFAERFRMPKQCIDDSLKGAEAVAYQRSRRPISLCTVATGCNAAEEEVVQVFLPHNNPLPWPINAPFNYAWSLNAYGKSWSYLKPRQQSDIEHLRRNVSFLVPTDFLQGTRYTPSQNTSSGNPLLLSRVADYHREAYPNLDFVSFISNGFGVMQQGQPGTLTLTEAGTGKAAEVSISLPAAFSKRVQTYQKTWERVRADYANVCQDLTYPWPATRSYTQGTWQPRDPNRSPDYVDTYTLQGARENRLNNGGQYSEDPNIWVYTTEFAKRFGMPLEWADDSLKGAYAISFRRAQPALKMKEDIKNWSGDSDVVDIYLPSDAGFPWIQGEKYRYNDNDSFEQAPDYLTSKNEFDADHWLRVAVTTRYLRTELTSPKLKGRRPIAGAISRMVPPAFGDFRDRLSGAGQGSFQKSLYPGIDRLELATINFADYDAVRYPKQSLIFNWQPKPENQKWSPKDAYNRADYRIDMPLAFLKRLQNYNRPAVWKPENWPAIKACRSKLQPWPPLCAANDYPCEWDDITTTP